MNCRSSPSILLGVLLWTCCTEGVEESQAADGQALGTVRGTVLDAATGAPTTCTVAITDSAGKTVVEQESLKSGFRCDGKFVKLLPPGRTRLRVTRGFETRAVERIVEVPSGGEVEVKIELERVVDLRKRGWYAGDSHAHMIHGERTIPVTFNDVALAARAEDLQYLSLAQDWILDAPTPESLQAELGGRSKPECVLTWNLEAPKNYYKGDAGRCLGHCWNMGVSGRTPAGQNVIEVLLQASAHDYQSDKPTFANFESHQLIHAQGGAAFYSHPARWWIGSWGGRGGYPLIEKLRVSNMAVELPVDTLIGPTFDGLDVLTGAGELEANAKAFALWCLLLNHGYRVAATASSDSCFDRPGGGTPGMARTYTYLADRFSIPAVARATARGRTFATTGPLLIVSVDDQPPGSALTASGQEHRMRIEAWASGADSKGLTRLELLRNGQPAQTHSFPPSTFSANTNLILAGTEAAWYCMRLYGGDPQRQRAISGAFFVDPAPFTAPAPLEPRVSVELLDRGTGEKLSGSVTEVSLKGTLPFAGKAHAIAQGRGVLTVPGTTRLRADVAGYTPQTLSPFLDQPVLVEYITRLEADDLVNWATFEHVRALLGDVKLTFRLDKLDR